VRYLARKYGANVIGIELTPARVAGGVELTDALAFTVLRGLSRAT
jgi:hypothetical protein